MPITFFVCVSEVERSIDKRESGGREKSGEVDVYEKKKRE